jgi:hypothetical protein
MTAAYRVTSVSASNHRAPTTVASDTIRPSSMTIIARRLDSPSRNAPDGSRPSMSAAKVANVRPLTHRSGAFSTSMAINGTTRPHAK